MNVEAPKRLDALPDGEATLASMLRTRAASAQRGAGFSFLTYRNADDPDVVRLSFGELFVRARAVAASLQASCARGARALIVCPPGFDYIAAFFGCQLAGMVAVPAYPPRNAKHLPRLRAIMEDAGVAAALVTDELVARLGDWAGDATRPPHLVQVDRIDSALANSWIDPRVQPDDLAFLQYTSGTTGAPRGVMVRHAQALENVRQVADLLRLGSADSGMLWLPPYHDMGLVGGLLVPVASGLNCAMMAPAAFLQRPARWLEAISALGATVTAAPNFAWRMCAEEISDAEIARLDLSTLRHALSGAELVRRDTLDAFARKFAGRGFRREAFAPVYGMAETVLLACGGARTAPPPALRFDLAELTAGRAVPVSDDPHDGGRGRIVVSCGRAIPGHQLRIVDPETGRPRDGGEVGEIWLSGPTIADGYWNRAEETARTFRARAADRPAGPDFLRTGDLGAVVEGELYVLGRIKEMIVVRGRKHYAQDIEASVAAGDPIFGQDRTVAFGIEEGGEERLVVLHELSRAALRDLDVDSLAAAARRSVVDGHEIDVAAIAFVRPASLPRTSSGKLRRAGARDLYLAGELDPVGVWRPASEARKAEPPDGGARSDAPRRAIFDIVRRLLAELANLDHGTLTPATELGALGLDSLQVTRLAARLGEATGRRLDLADLFEAPTLGDLAALVERAPEEGNFDPILPVSRAGPLPLSYQQEQLWFLQQLDASAQAAYTVVRALRLIGDLDRSALAYAVEQLVIRHESLRTRIAVADDGPSQAIDESGSFALRRESAAALRPEAMRERVAAFAREPFDLERGPLFRALLLEVSPDDNLIVLCGHHAVLDGWSAALLLREASELYRVKRAGRSARLPALGVQYADYAHWQRRWLAGPHLRRQMEFWRGLLAGSPEAISLPFDRARPSAVDYRGGSVPLAVPASLTRELKALGRSRRATLFMVLQAAFAVLLHRLGGDTDLVVGTAIAGRRRSELDRIAGYFANTLALRHRIDPAERFADLLDRTRAIVLAALENQDVPFEAVVEAMRPKRSLSHAPLMQTMLLQSQSDVLERELNLPGVEVRTFETEEVAAQFELSISLSETADGLEGALTYQKSLFDHASAERFVGHFLVLLAGIAADAGRSVSALPLLTARERDLVVHGFNATGGDFPRDRTVLDLFEERAAADPGLVAVIDGERQIGYGEIDRIANRLARRLRAQGVGPETVVAICLERSAELILALLAIWKAGGAYLPLDPAHPDERLAFMLVDADAKVIVTDGIHAQRLAALGAKGGRTARIALADDPASWQADGPAADARFTPAERGAVPDNLAYVIYTSGSTGKPKGVMIEHAGLMNAVAWIQSTTRLGPGDAVLQSTTATFDLSVWELVWWMVAGARVVMLAPGAQRDPAAVADCIRRHGVTVACFVPSQLDALLAAARSVPESPGDWSLRVVYTSGEPLGPVTVRAFHSGAMRGRSAQLINLYGPTEATIDVTAYRTRGDETSIPIGAPIRNARVHVVDANFEPQPIGVVGELVVGGIQLARGYLGRPGLTAEKFVADPFSGEPGARLYRTGDLGRWRANGELEFVGRADHQVKLRGMRVELGEIEAALAALPEIRQAAVVARRDAAGDLRLIAFIVPRGMPDEAAGGPGPAIESASAPHTRVDAENLRAALRRTLPDYMVPSGFVAMSRLPVNASGKVDRKALPDAEASAARATYLAPRTEVETRVASAFAELLGAPRVGLRDNFFDLGGHSLLAARLAARLASATGKSVPVRAVFEAPTVEALAARVEALPAGIHRIAVDEDGSAVSFQRELDWLWGKSEGYATTSNILFQASGPFDAEAMAKAAHWLIARHPMLGTRYVEVGTRLVPERTGGEGDAVHPVLDCSDWEWERIEAAIRERASAALDSESDCPFQMFMFRQGGDSHHILFKYCGSAFDLWSENIIMADLLGQYHRIASGLPAIAPTPAAAITYFDYSSHQRKLMGARETRAAAQFWADYLDGIPPALALPFDRPIDYNYENWSAGNAQFALGEAAAARLVRTARATGRSPYLLLLTAFCETIARIARQDRFCVFRTVSGRDEFAPEQIEHVVGLFASMQPFAVRFAGCAGWPERVRAVERSLAESEFAASRRFEAVQLDAVRRRFASIRPPRGAPAAPLARLDADAALAIYGKAGEGPGAGWDFANMVCQAAFNFYDYRGDQNVARIGRISAVLAEERGVGFARAPVEVESTADAYLYFSVIWHETVEVNVSYVRHYFEPATVAAIWAQFEEALGECLDALPGARSGEAATAAQ